MSTPLATMDQRLQQRLCAALGFYALVAGATSFSGWAFDLPRLTDWFNDGISIQPNTAILVALAGAGLLLLQYGYGKFALALGGLVAVMGGLNLLQTVTGADLGFNHQLLFGRDWGREATVIPGRFGPPASLSFILIGLSLVLLGSHANSWRRYVPGLALVVVLLMTFSLLGYVFGARNFYSIPWLSAIAFPTATMLLALAASLIMHVPECQPMLLLFERSSAGAMARTVVPILIVIIPLVIWLRGVGLELELYDLGTSRALSAAMLMLSVVGLMWVALMALRRRELREREADQRKDEFLATLAHELRNPLAPIKNAIAILKLDHGDREIAIRSMGIIERQTAHLVRLIDDLLDMSRISRGKLELRREHVELASIIHQAMETCRPMAELANQEITVTLPPLPLYLNADAFRLSQVFSNLLTNACKFAGQRCRISLTAAPSEGEVTVVVKDDGIGIPADKLGAIFEMFSQVDQSLERSQGGLGIGLTLAKRLVELHGGSIEAHSGGPGEGSEFVVRLPLAKDQLPFPKEPAHPPRANAKRRILIVDDNRDSAESLAEALKLTGNQTFTAYDGEEGVAVAEQQRPDVILLDIGMPQLNGFDACRRIRESEWSRKVLIVAMTGWGQEEYRRKSAAAGFDSHLSKPVDFAELMTLLACLPPGTPAAMVQE